MVGADASSTHRDHLCGYFIRRTILEQSKRAHVGHIGSALSIADIVAALYGGILHVDDPADRGRDRLVLSKGHAALALYAALRARGWIGDEELASFHGDATLLGVHPEHALRGVDFSTGSLGQGLAVAAGSALAARLAGTPRRTFAILSDAECDEGSTWEAVMFSAHHRLAGLIAIVDVNGQQALGYTKDVLSLAPLIDRWRAFGWDAVEVDGHDRAALTRAIGGFDSTQGAPHVVLARTTFGRGVSYMESQIKWHYWPMSDDEYRQALAEIEELGCAQRSSAR
ncbi:MAG TPA: transketolase [Candidatus Limnocylindria bacterium]|nr:transketolase [Candidatus Limnocylindria bacterium]